jgi:hypothetical protein
MAPFRSSMNAMGPYLLKSRLDSGLIFSCVGAGVMVDVIVTGCDGVSGGFVLVVVGKIISVGATGISIFSIGVIDGSGEGDEQAVKNHDTTNKKIMVTDFMIPLDLTCIQ